MSTIKHDLDHEVYLDPKDEKEHINHGMLEYKSLNLKKFMQIMKMHIKMMW
ncbi:MAG: hypothetical protein CM15mV2_0800 [uncultured marine virus]|nr:MAG: hypothetical protein CM15mV2_0800 [uncultured marine virus]